MPTRPQSLCGLGSSVYCEEQRNVTEDQRSIGKYVIELGRKAGFSHAYSTPILYTQTFEIALRPTGEKAHEFLAESVCHDEHVDAEWTATWSVMIVPNERRRHQRQH
ncbi:unnamed protein product [Nippostrongylus brasiliensis]|uniref:Transcriptional regulator n=1 Tax=Nippostrongylus brasiliensis TaxID=27835 RepID=A0A0N4XVC1_NIPBR|nr:unnamed protein product [Nippostrongylus brasiliensis]